MSIICPSVFLLPLHIKSVHLHLERIFTEMCNSFSLWINLNAPLPYFNFIAIFICDMYGWLRFLNDYDLHLILSKNLLRERYTKNNTRQCLINNIIFLWNYKHLFCFIFIYLKNKYKNTWMKNMSDANLLVWQIS